MGALAAEAVCGMFETAYDLPTDVGENAHPIDKQNHIALALQWQTEHITKDSVKFGKLNGGWITTGNGTVKSGPSLFCSAIKSMTDRCSIGQHFSVDNNQRWI